MIGRQHRVERRAGRRLRQQRAHRRVGEQQLAAGVDDRDRVLQLLDRRLKVGHLPGHLRAIGRQLLADGVEERAELAELVLLVEVELDAELALAEASQAAADHVDRPEEELRQQRRDQHRHRQRAERGDQCGTQRLVEVLADQQRRHADARRSNLGVAEQQRAAELEVLPLARVDRAQLRQRRPLEQLAEVADRRQPLPFERPIGVRHGHAVDIGQRRVHHVLRVEARLEDRAQAGIGAQRGERLGAADHHLLGAVVDRVGQQLGTRPALVEADARQPRQVQHTQDDDDHDDD